MFSLLLHLGNNTYARLELLSWILFLHLVVIQLLVANLSLNLIILINWGMSLKPKSRTSHLYQLSVVDLWDLRVLCCRFEKSTYCFLVPYSYRSTLVCSSFI